MYSPVILFPSLMKTMKMFLFAVFISTAFICGATIKTFADGPGAVAIPIGVDVDIVNQCIRDYSACAGVWPYLPCCSENFQCVTKGDGTSKCTPICPTVNEGNFNLCCSDQNIGNNLYKCCGYDTTLPLCPGNGTNIACLTVVTEIVNGVECFDGNMCDIRKPEDCVSNPPSRTYRTIFQSLAACEAQAEQNYPRCPTT